MKAYLNIILTAFWILTGCTDGGIGDCLVRTGDRTTMEYFPSAFSQIEVNDGLEVRIREGENYKVVVEAGEHIIDQIEVSVQDEVLHLEDHLDCDWARKYEKQIVYVECPNLKVIYQNGFGDIVSENTLHFDSLEIRPRYGTGNVNLTVDNHYVFVESHRNGTITIQGKTEYLHVGLLFSLPIFDGKDLKAQEVYVNHHTNNSLHVYPIRSLTGKIDNNGNVYFYHQPDILSVQLQGKGRVVDMMESRD